MPTTTPLLLMPVACDRPSADPRSTIAAYFVWVPVHVFVAPGRHVPARQLSPAVQRLPSLHAVPSAARGPAAHVPVTGLHVPATWH